MSRGKYSPWCYNNRQKDTEYIYNCYGEVPAIWDKDNYDEKLMFENYDSEGFDSYGYSAFELMALMLELVVALIVMVIPKINI